MDDYTREVMDVKSIVTRSLEKKGVLSKIRAELRANVFEAIEDEDKVVENKEGLPQALLGSCNDRARQLHASPSGLSPRLTWKMWKWDSGRLLSALVCEYLEYAQLEHSLKVYQPECNLQNDSWKSELGDFVSHKNGDSGPRLLDVLEGFLKFQSKTETMNGKSRRESETESPSSLERRNPPRRSSASDNLQRASASCFEMDDYTREMMDLKTLVTRTLEKKGVLAKIRAELRASVFEAIEEEDRVIQNNQVLPPALLGSCNDRARRLHASPSGRLLSALVCEYLDWAQLNHTLKPKESWKSELRDFSSNSGYELDRNGDSKPLLLDVLEGFFKFEIQKQNPHQALTPETLLVYHLPLIAYLNEGTHINHTLICQIKDLYSLHVASESDVIDLSSLNACAGQFLHLKDRALHLGTETMNTVGESEDGTEEVMRASTALENLQLDRKTRNLTSSLEKECEGCNK
ncbi:hypothetical protein Bca4012_021430 [Brassica carinata]